MPQCFVTTCGNYYGKTRGNSKIIYHMFPGSEDLALDWAVACTGEKLRPPAYSRVCSDHFSPSCYLRDLQHELLGLPLRRRLRPDAVPDRNLCGARNAVPTRSSLRIAKRESIETVHKNKSHGDGVRVEKTREVYKKSQGNSFGKKCFESGVNCKSYGDEAQKNFHVKKVVSVNHDEKYYKKTREDVVCNSMCKENFLSGLKLKCKKKDEISGSVKVPLHEFEYEYAITNAGSICW